MMSSRKNVAVIFIVALLARLLFSFHFQKYYFGNLTFQYGDTFTFLDPILNLIKSGEYIGDRFLTDSRYFRVPVYPFFLGFFHLAAPADLFDYAVATAQCLLGSVSAVLVYFIVLNLSRSSIAAILSGLLYALYPFALLWTPILYPETLYLFLTLALIYLASKKETTTVTTIWQGCILALMVLTKQYLALMLIVPASVILFSRSLTWRLKSVQFFVLMASFSLVLTPWVVRNYLASGKIIILMGETTGVRHYLGDMHAFMAFANKFDQNVTPYVVSVVNEGKASFPKHPQFQEKHRTQIESALMLAHKSGSSFQHWRRPLSVTEPPYQNRDKEINAEFEKLNRLFWQEVPLWQALESRRDALKKVVLKSDLENKSLSMNRSGLIKFLLFKYRVALLVLGFLGMSYLMLRRETEHHQKVVLAALLASALLLYCYFCVIIVHAEMRYLLTADVLISIFSGVFISIIAQLPFKRKEAKG